MKTVVTSAIIASLLAASSISSYAIYDPSNPNPSSTWENDIMIMSTQIAPISYQEYNTQESFERSEGHICESASDWVNTFMMKEGKVFAGTKIGYPENFTPTWKCNSYISDEIISWSQSDKNEYNTRIDRATPSEKWKVEFTIQKINKFLMTYSTSGRDIMLDRILEFIDTKVWDIIMNNPQDVALPDDVTSIYTMLRYLRYELVLSKSDSQTLPKIGNVAPITYTCEDGETTFNVYAADYIIDDMAFNVEIDEIHVSDGDFFLPNYVATKVASTTGEKYVWRNTETNEAYSFVLQSNKLTVYKDNMKTHTCSK